MHYATRNVTSGPQSLWRLATATLSMLALSPIVAAQDSRPAASSQPASRPGIVDYHRGIRINWVDRQVEVAAHVVLREGLLELFACSPNTREHESIVCIDARPLYLFQALGLVGLTPGHPSRVHIQTGEYQGAAGDPVEILVQYEQDGQTRQDPIERWMRRASPDDQRRPGEDLDPLPWVFAGSFMTDDGVFAADPEGTVISVVDFGSSLIALPDYHSDSNAELWLEPATERIPPVMSRCSLLFRLGPVRFGLDAAGRVQWSGRTLTLRETAQALRNLLRENPKARFRLLLDSRCPPDRETALLAIMDLLKIPRESITITRVKTPPSTQRNAKALSQWVGEVAASQPAEVGTRPTATEAAARLASQIENRAHVLQGRVGNITACLGQLASGFDGTLASSSRPAREAEEPKP